LKIVNFKNNAIGNEAAISKMMNEKNRQLCNIFMILFKNIQLPFDITEKSFTYIKEM